MCKYYSESTIKTEEYQIGECGRHRRERRDFNTEIRDNGEEIWSKMRESENSRHYILLGFMRRD